MLCGYYDVICQTLRLGMGGRKINVIVRNIIVGVSIYTHMSSVLSCYIEKSMSLKSAGIWEEEKNELSEKHKWE